MSGAFEVAAGAFAVVGVADVLVRAGRDLYNFLCDIEDAPNTANRLCDSVAETITLASASRRCLLQLNARTHATPITEVTQTMNLALKALDREVKSLKTLTTKCKGNSKRWSNIRYALSEQRISKALGNLEQSKSLLASALTLVDRELSGIEHEHIEELVQQSTQQTASSIGDMTQKLTAKFDIHEHAVSSRLNAFRQDDLVAQTSRQCVLDAKLDIQHQELKAVQKAHSSSLTAIQRAQGQVTSRQDRLLRASTQISRQTACISQDLKAHTRLSNKQHRMTMDLINSTLNPKRTNSGRQVIYAGEQRNLIMPALESIEQDLNVVFERLFTNHCHDVSPGHISWLQSEMQRLIASASQEKASLYPGSTATPFDSWIYPRHTTGAFLPEKQHILLPSIDIHGQTAFSVQPALSVQPKRRKRTDRLFSFNTSKGTLHVRLPHRKAETNAVHVFDEASISYTSVAGEPFLALHARFTRFSNPFTAPRICAQLQIFLPLEVERLDEYAELVLHATLQEFDRALRDGTVSPYRNDSEFGVNAVLLVAAGQGRVDILEYLESQGIGCTALQQEYSVSLGLMVEILAEHEETNVFERVDAVLSSCADPPRLLADLVMMSLTQNQIINFNDPDWSTLVFCLHRLHTICSEVNSHWRDIDLQDLQWTLEMVPDVVRFLLDAGAESNTVTFGQSLLQHFLGSGVFKWCISAPQGDIIRKQILGALIESGADVLHRDSDGDTVADFAWGYNHWDVWCEALEENGKAMIETDKSGPQGQWCFPDDIWPNDEQYGSGAEGFSMSHTLEEHTTDGDGVEDEDCVASGKGGSLGGDIGEDKQQQEPGR